MFQITNPSMRVLLRTKEVKFKARISSPCVKSKSADFKVKPFHSQSTEKCCPVASVIPLASLRYLVIFMGVPDWRT